MIHPELGACICPGCAAISALDDPGAPLPGENPEVVYSSQSGKPIYDAAAIVHALTTFDGAATSAAWAGNTVTYSIASGAIASGQPGYRTEYAGYVEMTAYQQLVAQEAFELWDDLIAIDLVMTVDNPGANILFNYSSQTSGNGTYASSSYSFTYTERADWALGKTHIWASNNWYTHDQDTDMYQGGYGVLTYLHEIGHALGLSHPGNYNGNGNFATDASYHQDTRTYTVQSYFQADANGETADHRAYTGAWRYGATPLLHDILAVQAIYGADLTTRTGDTVYGFNSTAGRDAYDFTKNTAPVIAIWDAGGIDTLDASGFGENQLITLVEGAFSNIGRQTMNVSIAYGAVIENAIGGSGNDRIFGNAVGNLLRGGAGNDTLFGGDGDDTLEGGAGADSIDGGQGIDLIRFTAATSGITVNMVTRVHGGDAAVDTFESIEAFEGTAWADSLTGDATTRMLYGLGGNDVLIAGSAGTSLYGGDGDDSLTAGAGADVIQGGNGIDRLSYAGSTAGIQLSILGTGIGGWAQGDIVSGIEHLIGSAFADTLSANGTGTTVDGGDGDDTLFDGAGDAVLIGGNGNDVFNAGAGADTIFGGAGRDTMRYANASAGVTVNLLTGIGLGSDAQGDVLSGIEDLVGSQHGDSLTGDAGANRLEGLAGNDTIDGGEGDDWLIGGDGADRIIGGAGIDTADYSASGAGVTIGLFRAGTGGTAEGDILEGIERLIGSVYGDLLIGGGMDPLTIEGGQGNDVIYDYLADAELYGGDGNDLIVAGGGNDRLFGGDGNDTLEGGAGADSIYGGAGIDLLRFTTATAGVVVNMLTGVHGGDAAADLFHSIEAFEGTAFADSLTGDANTRQLNGLGGNDLLVAGVSGTTLFGGDGDDTLIAGGGIDLILGGNGVDRVSYAGSNAGITLAITGIGVGGWAQGDIVSGVEYLIGSVYADTLTANGTGTTVDGGDGHDSLYDGAGDAVLIGGNGNDVFNAGGGADTIFGGAGRDTMRYANAGGGVTLNLAAGLGSGSDAEGDVLSGIEDVVGSQHADSLTGDDGANLLDGLAGNDTIDGGAGADTIFGGEGNDRLLGGAGADSIDGGNGDDWIIGGDGADRLSGGLGHDTVDYSASTGPIAIGFYRSGSGAAASGDTLQGFERLIGSAYADQLIGGGSDPLTIEGGAGNDFIFDYQADALLDGGEGNDMILGGAGRDTLLGGAGHDSLFGGAGADSIDGGSGTDWLGYVGSAQGVTVSLLTGTGQGGDAEGDVFTGIENLMGGEGNDHLTGDAGFNQLAGGLGNDTLTGGGGDDYLFGGAGADVFVYDAPGWGRDVIFDFEDGIDLIDLRGTGLTHADFTEVATPQGTRLDWFDGTSTLAIHLFGINPDQIDSFDFIV